MILEHTLHTPYGENLLKALDQSREAPVLAEYPRPQLVRDVRWLNLNGYWDYAFEEAAEADLDPAVQVPIESSSIPGPITKFRDIATEGEILVPFAPESLLSGVGRQLQPNELLWYKRTFTFDCLPGERVLLHAGAIDQVCSIWVDDSYVGSHRDGYLPFSIDITDALRTGAAEHRVIIAVRDPSDTGQLPWGKQKLERGGIWYTASSGIWQTIWLEAVPEGYISSVSVVPFWAGGGFDFTFESEHAGKARLTLLADGEAVGSAELQAGKTERLALAEPHAWTPEDPFLYDWVLETDTDKVTGYAGLRSVSLIEDSRGEPCLSLNGEVRRHVGVLDQGYWSDGLLTAPSDQALIDDILAVKQLGYNMIRKHIKIEPQRWYYHCDRLGMLVWQDMVNGGNDYRASVTRILPFTGIKLSDKHVRIFGRGSRRKNRALAGAKGRAAQKAIIKETYEALKNTVSIVLWTPFNEGWGQFDALKIARDLKLLDPTRLVDHASGWHDQGGPDLKSVHVYFKRFRPRPDPLMRPLALTEYGGYSLPVDGHMASDALFGYKKFASTDEYHDAVLKLKRKELLPVKQLAASVYTQLSDVEDEINGLLTYDRKVNKWAEPTAAEALREVNEAMQES